MTLTQVSVDPCLCAVVSTTYIVDTARLGHKVSDKVLILLDILLGETALSELLEQLLP